MSFRSSGILTSNSAGRSRLTPQSPQSQRTKPKKDQQMAYFKDVIIEAGVILQNDEMPNVITQEQSLVIRDINKTLRSHITYPNNAQEFMTGLKILCRNEALFRKALLPTELQKDSRNVLTQGTSAHSNIQQESLVRMLLNVICLQNEVVELLLEQVTDCAPEEREDTTWLRLLLNPLRYLSHIHDSKALTTKLLDILEIATYTAQLEMLNLIPEIIPDNEYEDSAKSLSKLLEENVELTGAIIDCLNSLNLNPEVRGEIQQQVLAKLESTASSKIFPILFEFLITDCNSKHLQTVLLNSRNAIDKIMLTESSEEAEAHKVLLFNRLQAFTMARKTLCEGWIAVISNIRSTADEKPIDLLILFMLHSVVKSRKSAVEALIRKRLKSGLFKISLLETLFEKYLVSQILKDQLNSIIEIARDFLLRSSTEPTLVEFSSVIFKMLFSHELVERIQRQDIIYNLLLLTGMSDKKSVTPILNILRSLLEEDFPKMQQHTVQLMGLLEKLDTIELKDVKLVFEVLCSLTCGEKADDSMSGLRDEIHMIVRKQLSSAKKIIKHRGIIAAVVMAKTLATKSEEQSDIVMDDTTAIEDLPRGAPQDAAALLILANKCTLGSPDSVGLYYDQLASMVVTASNLDNSFMAWLYNLTTNDFQYIFVTESIPESINDIPITMQFSLNTTEEVDSPIAVKIAEMCLKSQFFENNSILTLAPLFRLLRLLHFRQHDKDLSSIDALLGCAVLMPNLEDIDDYESDQLKQVSDCTFHCINWFREIISAFVSQKSRKLRHKVLERLAGVVQLEEILEKCLRNIPDHKLPLSYFDVASQASKQSASPAKPAKVARPRKKQKLSETIVNPDETIASTSAALPSQQTKATKKKPKELTSDRDVSFREMDTDVILLLRYPLKINQDIDSSFSQITARSQPTILDLNQLKFLLKDFVVKLEALSTTKNMGLSHMNVVNMTDFIKDCVRLLPYIKKHLNTILLYLDQLTKQTDGCLDSEQMITPEANNVKLIFALIMKSFTLIFGWSGFQHITNLNLLKDCLKALRDETQSQLMSVKGLAMEFTGKLLGYVDHCVYLPAAVSLVQVIQALYCVNSHDEIKKRITVVSGKLLTKKWYSLNGNLETGKNASLNIDFLVKAYLNDASVKTICGLVGTLQKQVGDLKSKEDCLGMLASINKLNFYIFYKGLCVTPLKAVREEVSSLTNNQHLVLWRTTALTMQGLMTVAKAQPSKTNLVSFLKNSVGILKVFLSNGVPILEIMLRSKTDEVVEIFKIMQTSTRFLHHLCCYSKFTKDSSLVAYVPQFRLLLESLLYRVKAALVANGCSAAFWMGTLRNRDLHGEDIISQSSMETEETATDNEELLPDDSDEEEVPGEDGNDAASDGDTSASEIF